MPKLKINQVIALEKGAKGRSVERVNELYHLAQKAPLFSGVQRKYQPFKEEDNDRPDEQISNVQQSAKSLLTEMAKAFTELFDVTATKEWGNLGAIADVVVDGKVLLSAVPVTYLLFLEKKLTDVHTFVSKLPRLDPAERWSFEAGTQQYFSQEVETVRTQRKEMPIVLYDATDKHPAQTQMISQDVPVGRWKTTKFSGALPPAEIDALLGKINKLRDAVKVARQEANSKEVEQKQIGAQVFDFLLK